MKATPIVRGLIASLVATTLVLYGLIALGSAAAFSQTSAVSVPGSARLSGVVLQTYNDPQLNPNFAQIAADKANMVNISVWWVVPSPDSDAIAPEYNGPTILDSKLIAFIQEAQAVGLQVSITPDFVVETSDGAVWRGGYDPGKTSNGDRAFFANYTNMVDHYATIAADYQLPMYWVGSEMIDSEQYTSDWDTLIASVRQIYGGKLLYDANWSSLGTAQFYRSLDAMSVSAYWPLSTDADPSLDVLLNAWKRALAQLQHQEQVWQLPVYFGEVGYDYSTYAEEAPYDETYVSSDPELQYRCYEALDETFRTQSWWGGVLWWAWDGGVYNMDGEPAESLIGVSSVAYPPATAPVTPSTASTTSGSAGHRTQPIQATPTTSASHSIASDEALPSTASAGITPTEPTTVGTAKPTTSVNAGFPSLWKSVTVNEPFQHASSAHEPKLRMMGLLALLLLLADLVLAIRALRLTSPRGLNYRRFAFVRRNSPKRRLTLR